MNIGINSLLPPAQRPLGKAPRKCENFRKFPENIPNFSQGRLLHVIARSIIGSVFFVFLCSFGAEVLSFRQDYVWIFSKQLLLLYYNNATITLKYCEDNLKQSEIIFYFFFSFLALNAKHSSKTWIILLVIVQKKHVMISIYIWTRHKNVV